MSQKDPSSTWLYGKNGRQEGFLSYILLNYFRANTPVAFGEAVVDVWSRKRARTQFLLEATTLLVVFLIIGLVNPWFFLPLFLFSYMGWALTDLQNYFEHYRARNPESRFADSVSYYGRLYNLLMFNEGYHQEHHIEPGTHWSKRPIVRQKYQEKMKSAGHYVSPVPLSLGFLDHSPLPDVATEPESTAKPEELAC